MATKSEEKLRKIVEEEAAKYIKDARQTIRQKLNAATLSLLGLETGGYGKVEIDHCNGRNSVLVDAFRALAKEEAEKLARTYKPSSEDIINFQAAFEREFKSNFSYVIRDLAKAKAQEEAKKALELINIDVEKLVDSSLGD